MGSDSGSISSIAADLGAATAFGGSDPHQKAPHARHLAAKGRPRLAPPRRRAVLHGRSLHQESMEKVLSESEFLAGLNRETRRAERSGASLSLVLYRFNEGAADGWQHIEPLLAVLMQSKRETDILGHFGTDTIAILCPDTNEAGAKGFMHKFDELANGLTVSVAAATYPDHLFESLSNGASTRAALDSFIGGGMAPTGGYTGKRFFDIVSALMMLCVLGFPMLLVALLVKLSSPGPVIFKQLRLGKGGVAFTFYKFRSMVNNVDDRIHRDYVASLIRGGMDDKTEAEPGEAVFKMKSDPRITPIGKLIRMTSVDELPQLFNVLKGDMSMVGPRPPIPYEAAHYEPWHLRRILAAKPGITGLWQVEGRSRVTFSEMVRMDLRYIRRCSLRLDLKILIKTVAVVLRCDGAR